MSFLEKIGHFETNLSKSFTDIFFFAGIVLLRMFRRKIYSSAMRSVLVNQIYFTSVQILPVFIAVSIIFGSLLIGIVFQLLKGLGLYRVFRQRSDGLNRYRAFSFFYCFIDNSSLRFRH